MKLLRSLDALPEEFRSGALAIGNFDGVHLGHARICERLVAQAQSVGGRSMVFTFDPHPVRLLRPDQAPPPLTWTDRKARLLAELGVDAVLAYPTDEALLKLTAREFFDQIIRQRLDARAIVEGPNFYFGRDRSGNVAVLAEFARQAGIQLEVVEPLVVEGETVSSSRIRRLISGGAVQQARRLLTRPYRIRGMVTHGAGRGSRIGFPTANLGAIDTLLPAPGVYAGRVNWRGQPYAAAINLGANPTFGEDALKVEVHLIDFTGQLYGEPLEVDFLVRLRDTRPFDGVDALRAQLQADVVAARAAAAGEDRSNPSRQLPESQGADRHAD